MKTELKYNPKTEVLVLRACRSDLTSRNGFIWKNKHVKAPDWSPSPTCGQGLHGWLNGQGDTTVWSHEPEDKWLILAVKKNTVVDLQGKVKFPTARKLFVGTRDEAATLLASLLPGVPVMYATATAGYKGTATAGYKGTATAGYKGTATAGYKGTATAGDEGTATAGNYGAIQIKWWDSSTSRYRISTAYVDEDGIEANTAYKLNDNHQFVRA